ncbi:MAG: hypothetical protein WC683_07915 [bacterium]
MSVSALLITDFTGGELTPKLSGRSDLLLYAKGCLTLENWMPFSQGGIITRPGSKYLATTKNNVQGRLYGWKLPNGVSYMLEFTALVLRFWKADGTLFGAPLELTTPYTTAAHCRELRFAVDGNTLFISHTSYAIRQVTWTGSTFTIATSVIVGNTGAVPFSATGDYPGAIAGYGQRLWFGRSTNQSQTVWASRAGIYVDARAVSWAASTAYEIGDIVSNGATPLKLYTCITAGTSAGSGGPTTTAADITDGTAHWSYWCATGGIDMTYYERLRYDVEQLTDVADWADPDIPELETVTVYRNVVTADAAMELTLASDTSMVVQELVAGTVLLISTAGVEYVVPPDMTALTPEKLQPSTHFGGAAVPACLVGSAMLFWQNLATRLREYPTAGATEESVEDLSYHAEHLFSPTAGTVVESAFAGVPWPIVYAVRSDGVLCALAYDKKLGMRAWHRLESGGGGLYKSVGVADGTSRSAVWAIVLRGTYYCVELFDGIEDLTAIPLDAWVDVATAGATVTGLDRFNGTTATIWNATEEAVYTAAVAAGSMTTPAACVGDHLVVGAGFTCTMQSMRLVTDGPYGTGQMRIRKVAKILARVLDCYPFKFGRVTTSTELETVPITGPYTGDVECPFRGDWNVDTWVMAIQDQPYRSQILALIPEVDT